MRCRFVAVFVAGLALVPTALPEQKAAQPRWLDDVAAAQAEARRAGKPIFAVLH